MMDPKVYCESAMARQRRRPARRAEVIERAQVRILLAHFARFAPPDEDAFARDLAALARRAERDGRSTLARAAREILADWEARRAGAGGSAT